MEGLAGGSCPWSEDWRVRRSDFQGCAGSSKLAFCTGVSGGGHILGEAVGASMSSKSVGYLHVKQSSSDRFEDASEAVVGVRNFYVGESVRRQCGGLVELVGAS